MFEEYLVPKPAVMTEYTVKEYFKSGKVCEYYKKNIIKKNCKNFYNFNFLFF